MKGIMLVRISLKLPETENVVPLAAVSTDRLSDDSLKHHSPWSRRWYHDFTENARFVTFVGQKEGAVDEHCSSLLPYAAPVIDMHH